MLLWGSCMFINDVYYVWLLFSYMCSCDCPTGFYDFPTCCFDALTISGGFPAFQHLSVMFWCFLWFQWFMHFPYLEWFPHFSCFSHICLSYSVHKPPTHPERSIISHYVPSFFHIFRLIVGDFAPFFAFRVLIPSISWFPTMFPQQSLSISQIPKIFQINSVSKNLMISILILKLLKFMN